MKKTTAYKINYELEAGPLILPLVVYFIFTPGSQQTAFQPTEPDEIEVTRVNCPMLSTAGEYNMMRELDNNQQFNDWLKANREKAEAL